MGLYHIDWTRVNKEPKLRRFLTDEAGKRLDPVLEDLSIPPFFYAYADAAYKVFPPSVFEPTGITVNGREVVKFVASSPDIVPIARDAIGITETFEADVPYGRRVLIETGESLSLPKRYVHFDIETDPTGGMPNPELADRQIFSIATKTNDGEERFFCRASEDEMLEEFRAYVTDFPVLCTFNGNHFDWPYLLNRCKRLGIAYEWDWLHVHMDLLAIYKFCLQKRQDKYSLEHIAKEERLTARKRFIEISRLPEYYNSFLDSGDQTLKDYNLDDVRVSHELDHKLSMVEIVYNIAAISHTTVKDLLRVHEKSTKEFNVSVAVDGLILYLSARRTPRIVWRTKEYKELSEEEEEARHEKKFAGAHVVDPVVGVHKNVALLDVNSLYPTIIQSFNVGPETYVPGTDIYADDLPDYISSPVGRGYFRKEPKSVFVEALELVLAVRREYKARMKATNPALPEWKAAFAMDYAHKVLALSFYGVLGSEFSRYYNKDVAENVTLTGQAVIKFLQTALEGRGMKVVLGDTDSVAFVMPDMSVETAGKIAEELTVETQQYLQKLSGVLPTLMRLEIDKLCSAMYIQPSEKADKGTKKRYAAFVTWQGVPTFYLLVKGFQVVRHDSSEAQKEFQTQGLMLNLSDATGEQKLAFADAWKLKLYAGELDDKIVMHRGLGKEPDEYKVIPPQLRVGRRLQEEGKLVLHKGDKIAYLKVGPRPDDVVPVGTEKLSLTREQRAFVWDNQFGRIARRLGINAPKEVPLKVRGKQATSMGVQQ